ncbi:MAG: RDD family protein [Gemmatimonadetes bacterium]|nr:RDD family protein [Gemmatimonadota bacterium]NNK49330.1 RDD family protein [Gemmatimonadota bacterium]
MANGRDPREIITPDAFSVSPDLLGLPLAHPWRRAAAILIDLALIGLLTNARAVLFALAGGTFLFWLAFRGRKAGLGSAAARGAIGCGGALAVFVAVLAIWGTLWEDRVLTEVDAGAGEAVPLTAGAVVDLGSILLAEDSVEVDERAVRLVRRWEEEGISPEQMREMLPELTGDDDNEPALRALERAIGWTDGTTDGSEEPDAESLDLDSLLAAYASARAAGDTATELTTAPVLGRRLAQTQWDAREREVARLESRSQELAAELEATGSALEQERNRGIIATIMGFLDELGLGIGWSGLYFTFLTAFFRGRTPGKRLFGIRVLRLDGNALSYWVAFERFGGYAASLFTGMEGFLRILWDRNRQCLQDKLAETVVIRETKEARAQLAVGAAQRAMSDEPWQGGPIRGT